MMVMTELIKRRRETKLNEFYCCYLPKAIDVPASLPTKKVLEYTIDSLCRGDKVGVLVSNAHISQLGREAPVSRGCRAYRPVGSQWNTTRAIWVVAVKRRVLYLLTNIRADGGARRFRSRDYVQVSIVF